MDKDESRVGDLPEAMGGLTRRSVLARGAAGAVAASTLGAMFAQPAFAKPSMKGGNQLMVGAGKSEISIPVSIYQAEGFNDIHDPLYARVVVAKTNRKSMVLVVLDLTSIGEDQITEIRTGIAQISGVAAEDIVVTVTHHFSGPHVGSPPGTPPSADELTWIANIVSASTTACTTAVQGLQSARVGYGIGRCDVNVNRNLLTYQGYDLGANDNGPSDKTVMVARFDDATGNPIVILTNYSVQSSVMGPNGPGQGSYTSGNPSLPCEVSSDLAGAAATWVETQYPGLVAPFLCGATGDQQPAFRSLEQLIDKNLVVTTQDAGADGWTLLTVQGQRLGIEIVRVAESIQTETTSDLALKTKSITLPTVATVMGEGAPTKSHIWTINGSQALPVWVFRIGNGVFAGTPPELSTPTLLAIRRHSPFQYTFVMSMFEGGNKNMPDMWNYDNFTYESLDGNWAPGDAEKYVHFVAPLIRHLH